MARDESTWHIGHLHTICPSTRVKGPYFRWAFVYSTERLFWVRCCRSRCGLPGSFFKFLESGSQKVQHLFGGFKVKANIISITNQVPAENSADLERADSARSIAA